jgi:hypothetical protein
MSSTAFLEKDYRAQERQWVERCLLEPAKKKWQGQPWADEAAKLVQEALQLQETEHAVIEPLGGLAARFRTLLGKSGNDPLISLLAARALYDERRNWRDAQPALERLLNGGVELPAALECQALFISIPRNYLRDQDGDTDSARLAAAAIRAINDGSYDTAADAVFVRHQIQIMDLEDVQTVDRLSEWQKAIHDSQWPEWVKLTLEGWAETELAWLERSSKWAGDVTRAQWQGFAAHLKLARDLLAKSNRVRPDRPEAASAMIRVCMGENVAITETRAWFDRAVSAQFDYAPAYSGLMWAYRPRWAGSHDLMLAFGNACADTKRFDTMVPSRLMSACIDITGEVGQPQPVFRHKAARESLIAISQGYLDAPDAAPQIRHMRTSNAAMCAWLADDDVLALRALKAAGGRLHSVTVQYLNGMMLHEDMLRQEASADAGVFGDAVRAASTANDRKKLAEALAKIPTEGLSAEAKDYVAEGREIIAFDEALASGKWVPLKPRPGLTNFYQTGSRWTVEADGSLVATGDDTRWTQLAYRAPTKEDIEMRGEIAFEVPEPDPAVANYAFGPMLHWLPSSVGTDEGGANFLLFRDGPTQGCVQIVSTKFKQATRVATLALQPKNTFKARLVDKKISYEINGRPINRNVPQDDIGMGNQGGFIGFTAFRLPWGVKVRLTDIEVRKVDAATLAAEAKTATTAKATTAKPVATATGSSYKLYWQLGALGAVLLVAFFVNKFVQSRET